MRHSATMPHCCRSRCLIVASAGARETFCVRVCVAEARSALWGMRPHIPLLDNSLYLHASQCLNEAFVQQIDIDLEVDPIADQGGNASVVLCTLFMCNFAANVLMNARY